MAVSQAIEDKSTGSKTLESNCKAIHLVGGTTTIKARPGSVDVICMDSSLMLSLVSEDFNKKSSSQPVVSRKERSKF